MLTLDELQVVISYLPLTDFLNMMTTNQCIHSLMKSNSFWHMMVDTYYHLKTSSLNHNEDHCYYEKLFKRLFSSSFSRTDCLQNAVTFSENGTVVSGKAEGDIPVRMELPIFNSDQLMLCVEWEVTSSSYISAGVGVVSSPLLTGHLGHGFNNSMFVKPVRRENVDPNYFYLGCYYLNDKQLKCQQGQFSSEDFPIQYFNAGYFSSGYMACCGKLFTGMNVWDKGSKVTMQVNLTYQIENNPHTGFIKFFVNGVQQGNTIYGIYDPTADSPYDMFVALNIPKSWTMKMKTQYRKITQVNTSSARTRLRKTSHALCNLL